MGICGQLQGGEALPTPQMLQPNASRSEDATQWLCLDRQTPSPLLSAAPDQCRTTGRTQPCVSWDKDPSGRASVPCQWHQGRTGWDTGLCDRGLRGAPQQDPVVMNLLEQKTKEKENIPIPASTLPPPWCCSEYKHVSPHAHSQV